MSSEESEDFMRRYVHDYRNHLNSLEMELLLLETLVSDSKCLDAIERIRDESGSMELKLRILSNHFKDADLSPVSALDLFNKWKSRKQSNRVEDEKWDCSLTSEVINLDLNRVADSLHQRLIDLNTPPSRIRAYCRDNEEVCFEFVHPPGEKVSPPPGFIESIERNGGWYRRESSGSEGAVVEICGFPVVSGGA